jgi:hypothetical protein
LSISTIDVDRTTQFYQFKRREGEYEQPYQKRILCN